MKSVDDLLFWWEIRNSPDKRATHYGGVQPTIASPKSFSGNILFTFGVKQLVQGNCPAVFVLAKMHEHDIYRHAVDPSMQCRVSPKHLQLPEYPQKNVLREVLRKLKVLRHTQADVEYSGAVVTIKGFKRFFISLLSLFDKLEFIR